jgi:hypothetical protein
MAMSADILGPAMKGAIDALTDEQKKDRDAVFKAMAGAIVQHIQTTATLVGLVVVGTSVSGGAVTGTATGAPGSIE